MAKSLSFQILLGFVVVALLLTLLLLSDNSYAMNVVRSQIAEANRNLLTRYVADLENQFEEVNNYLYGLVLQDNDIQILSLNSDPDDVYFAQQRIISKLLVQRNIMRDVDAFFVYSASSDNLINITSQNVPFTEITDAIRSVVTRPELPEMKKWFPFQVSGKPYLIRIVRYNSQISVGAAIDASELIQNIPVWSTKAKMGINLVTDDWKLLIDTGFDQASLSAIQKVGIRGDMFQTVRDKTDSSPLLLVGNHLDLANLSVVYTIPEKQLLANLPSFQRLIYLIPWVMVVLVCLYLVYMRQILLMPMKHLIKGMQRIRKGNWDIRLSESGLSREFETLNQTFNQMVAEIHDLKLEAYEKQLEAQEAQFKQLQAQINPHFFLNALNITYSLAGLQEYQLVQKMLAHIVDYLRFITRTAGDQITLIQELDHIRSYLEIQKLRFPNRLDYRLVIDERFKSVPIPPLIVQPIVENAVIHGFKQELGLFLITISVDLHEGNQLEITVQDNGSGFSDAQLESWRRFTELPAKHIGIRNIIERLQIKYAAGAGILFENAPEGGAWVRLRIPYSAAAIIRKET